MNESLVTKSPKRIALIGIGDIARKVYLPLLSAHPGVHLVGVVSRNPQSVQHIVDQYRLDHGTTNLEEISGWDLEAVFVHSATPSHYDVVTRCMELGLHVYVDKPLSYDLTEARQMTALAEQKGLLLAVGFNRRFAPLYRNAYAWLAEAGGLEIAEVTKHRTRLQSIPARETVYDDLIHMLDLLLWLGDQEYQILAHQLKKQGTGAMHHASGMLSIGRERYGHYSMVRSAGADLEKIALHGGGRSAEVINMELLRLYEKDMLPREQIPGSWESVLERRGFAGIVDHFLDRLDSPEQCSIRADLVFATHELADQLTAGL